MTPRGKPIANHAHLSEPLQHPDGVEDGVVRIGSRGEEKVSGGDGGHAQQHEQPSAPPVHRQAPGEDAKDVPVEVAGQ
ncbi:hypothetical protein E2C01_023201 [Portunus trituberculatus]|uniref:Uncharacterized protein n=1 Tax=Portunus trituberculatus TaxID=210409 RepID=A0A5B7E867_PORTR|nr:hypothetical protein [Portunus trituberculatus]